MMRFTIILVLFLFLMHACSLFRQKGKTEVIAEPNAKTTLSSFNLIPRLSSSKREAFDKNYFEGVTLEIVENEYEEAVGKFQQCLLIYPESHASMYHLGRLYYSLERFADGMYIMEQAVLLDEDNLWYWKLLTDIYVAMEEFGKAEESHKKLVYLDPYEAEYKHDLANIYIIQGKYDEAIELYNLIEEQIGITEKYSNQKKKLYLKMNRLDLAVKEIEKLIQSNPQNTGYLLILSDLYYANERSEEYVRVNHRILEIDSNHAASNFNLGEYYIKQKKPDSALFFVRRAMAVPDYDIENKLSFIFMHYLRTPDHLRNDTLLQEFSLILRTVHPSNARAYAYSGDVYADAGLMDSALVFYLKALEFEKSVVLIWKKAINTSISLNKFSMADSISVEAMVYFPFDPELYLLSGVSRNQLKNYEKAIDIMEEGLEYLIGSPFLEYQMYLNLAEAYHALGDYVESDRYFEKALSQNPDDPLVLNNYAYYLSLRKEKLDLAESMSERSIKFEPQNAAFLDTYAWILFQKGEYKKADTYMSKAIRLNSENPVLLEHYGDIQFKLENIDEAIKYWERAREKNSTSKNLEKKILEKMYYED